MKIFLPSLMTAVWSWDPRSGRREPTASGCPLTSTRAVGSTCNPSPHFFFLKTTHTDVFDSKVWETEKGGGMLCFTVSPIWISKLENTQSQVKPGKTVQNSDGHRQYLDGMSHGDAVLEAGLPPCGLHQILHEG